MVQTLGFWSTLFWIGLSAVLIWYLFRSIRNNPEAFQAQALSKSSRTLGLLALFLIGLIGFVVLILKQS